MAPHDGSGRFCDQNGEGLYDEGSLFLGGFDADESFSGTVRVDPSCREGSTEVSIVDGEPQDSLGYTREECGESCSFELYVDDELAEQRSVGGAEGSYEIVIDGNGDLDMFCEIN